jgi:hypothetical protein
MVGMLVRSLKSDTMRSGFYLLAGCVLFALTAQAFGIAVVQSRQRPVSKVALPGTQVPGPLPERYVPPAPVEYPFF